MRERQAELRKEDLSWLFYYNAWLCAAENHEEEQVDEKRAKQVDRRMYLSMQKVCMKKTRPRAGVEPSNIPSFFLPFSLCCLLVVCVSLSLFLFPYDNTDL